MLNKHTAVLSGSQEAEATQQYIPWEACAGEEGQISWFMLCKNVNRRLSPSTGTAAAITFFLGVFLTHFEMLEGELPKSCCCIISAIWGSLLLHTGDGHPQQTGLYQQVYGKSQGNSLWLHRSFQYEVHSKLLNVLVKTLPCKQETLHCLHFRHQLPRSPFLKCLTDIKQQFPNPKLFLLPYQGRKARLWVIEQLTAVRNKKEKALSACTCTDFTARLSESCVPEIFILTGKSLARWADKYFGFLPMKRK